MEAIKFNGTVYDTIDTPNGKIMVSKNGVLGHDGVLVTWDIIETQMVKRGASNCSQWK
tara:strand:+ start:17572 stop:17745 length:174 start_codon:yes stop_codon:yes gene_type:complete